MQHIPEHTIPAPVYLRALQNQPGCRSISDDDLCAWCVHLLYRPGELSLCSRSPGDGVWPSVCDRNGYAHNCPVFQPNIIHP